MKRHLILAMAVAVTATLAASSAQATYSNTRGGLAHFTNNCGNQARYITVFHGKDGAQGISNFVLRYRNSRHSIHVSRWSTYNANCGAPASRKAPGHWWVNVE